jgi:hypothetical protein
LGLLFETSLAIIVAYITAINRALGTRPIACPHFAIPAMSYFVIIFFFDEARKVFLRNGIDKSVKGRIRFKGWVARNTLW